MMVLSALLVVILDIIFAKNQKNTMIWNYHYFFRLHSDVSGGAWCPAKTVSRDTPAEYLEVDLMSMHVITATYTQGRFGNGRGQEYAEHYRIQYWRPGLTDFIDYHDNLGRKVRWERKSL